MLSPRDAGRVYVFRTVSLINIYIYIYIFISEY